MLPAPLPEHAARPSAKTAPIAAIVIRRIAVLLLIVERPGVSGLDELGFVGRGSVCAARLGVPAALSGESR